MAKKNYEQIRVDLRPYGWGIRDVDVIPPDTELGPDSVGSEEIKDEGVSIVGFEILLKAGESANVEVAMTPIKKKGFKIQLPKMPKLNILKNRQAKN